MEIEQPNTNDIKQLPSRAKLINTYKGMNLYWYNKKLHFNDSWVHPEFVALNNIPFTYHLSLTYNNYYYTNTQSMKGRGKLISTIISKINASINKKYQGIASGNRTVRFVAVSEHGGSIDEYHSHVLIHIHPNYVELVATLVWDLLVSECKRIEMLNKNKKDISIREMCLQSIYNQPLLVSYLCKYEFLEGKKDHYKEFIFSQGFKKIAKAHHCSQQFKYKGQISTIGAQDDPYENFRFKRQYPELIDDQQIELSETTSLEQLQPEADQAMTYEEKIEQIMKSSKQPITEDHAAFLVMVEYLSKP